MPKKNTKKKRSPTPVRVDDKNDRSSIRYKAVERAPSAASSSTQTSTAYFDAMTSNWSS